VSHKCYSASSCSIQEAEVQLVEEHNHNPHPGSPVHVGYKAPPPVVTASLKPLTKKSRVPHRRSKSFESKTSIDDIDVSDESSYDGSRGYDEQSIDSSDSKPLAESELSS